MEQQTIKASIDKDEQAWQQLIEWVVTNFAPGELISHELLKQKFLLQSPAIEDFETIEELKSALDLLNFEYMTLVDKMRWDILDEYKYYMNNVRGQGYSFLVPSDQVKYAFSAMVNEVKKAIKEGSMIATNRRFDNISQETLSKDNDLIAKMGMMKQLFTGIK